MKNILFFFLLLLAPVFVISQDVSAQYFLDDLKKAESLQDTIASFLAFKMNPPRDTVLCLDAIDQGLKAKYNNWYEAEKSSLRKESAKQTIALFDKTIAKNPNNALKPYAASQQYIRTLKDNEKGIAPTRTMTKLNNEDFVLYTAYSILEHRAQRNPDSMLYDLTSMTDTIPDDVFPRLQLACIALTISKLFSQLPKENEHLIDLGLKISQALNEYKYRSDLYHVQAVKFKERGDYKNAIIAVQNVIDMVITSRDSSSLALHYYNLSSFHQEQGRFDEAYKIMDKGLEVAQALNDTVDITLYYSTKAFAKMNNSKYEEALLLLKKSLIHESKLDRYKKAMLYTNIIDSYYTTNKLDSAYYYYSYLEKIDPDNQTGFLDYAKTFIAQYLVEKGDFKLAQEFIDDALADAEAYESLSDKSIVLRAQSRLWEAKGDYKQALVAYKEHMDIEQDFRNEEKAAEITAAQLNSEFNKEKEVIALQNEKEQIILKEKQTRTAILGFGALFGLALLSLFYIFLRKKNNQIEEKNTQLNELNNVKDTLFQIIGHDLKKPSINFRNISKNINYLLDKKDYSRLQALGDEVDQDAKSLYNLTDNLLNWALVQKEGITIKKENINVHQLVQYNIELFQSIAARKKITLTNNVDALVDTYVDRNSLDTIIRNLLDNAIKYTKENGIITITSKEVNQLVQVAVADNGVGIDHELIAQLNSDKIVHSNKGTEGEKGSGIGLQLVKQLIRKNSGTLRIDSTKGSGSCFTLYLPMAS